MQTCINMQKIRLFNWFVLEILLIKKSCNLIGWEAFGLYDFPKYGICAGTANNTSFHFRTNTVKINAKFFNKFKNPSLAHFWSIFKILGAKKIFAGNLAQPWKTSYEFLVPCQNLEKINDTILIKRLDKMKDGRTD